MSLIRFSSMKNRKAYIDALKVIWTYPVRPGRFYLVDSTRFNHSLCLDEWLQSVLNRDDYEGTTRPIHLYIDNFEECLKTKAYGLGHSYTLAHNEVWPSFLSTYFLHVNSNDQDVNLDDLTWLKGNYSPSTHSSLLF